MIRGDRRPSDLRRTFENGRNGALRQDATGYGSAAVGTNAFANSLEFDRELIFGDHLWDYELSQGAV